MPFKKRFVAYRSGLEKTIEKQLLGAGIPVQYESLKLEWVDPKIHRYTVDFVLPNGIILETKGWFRPEDRRKHLLIKAQHPERDIRFIFTRASARLNKTSKTTYADWCDKHGFLWAEKTVPVAWLKEKKT